MRQILFAPIVVALVLAMAPLSQAADRGNTANDSFNTAKRLLERQVYHDHRVTVYCGATFDSKKNIDLPQGFTTPSHAKRALRVEWEHAVPAENFGRAFVEWREGDAQCVNKNQNVSKNAKDITECQRTPFAAKIQPSPGKTALKGEKSD